MRIADSHCHLQDERIAPEIEAVLGRAAAAGVRMFVCCGSAEADWNAVAAISARPGVIACYGLHPWYIRERTPAWRETLASMLRSDSRSAVGEIGLDHAIADRDEVDQMRVFVEQLHLAAELGRPASIHCRKAWGAILPALREVRPTAGFVIHSYSGSRELIGQIADLGGFFSFSGTVTWSRNRRAHETAAAVPVDRLLVETDSPDLPPAPEDGCAQSAVNEPANLPRVLRAIAALRGMEPEELATVTWANTTRLFGSP